MVPMQTIIFSASLLLSSGGRVQRAQNAGSIAEEVGSEVRANTTKFWNDKCYADKASLLHNFVQVFQKISPANLVFPLYGVSTPPLYKMGDCEFQAEAGIMLTLEGIGDVDLDYKCAYPESNQGASCDTVWCGRRCRWPMDTTIKFNSPLGLRLSAGADLNLCGISTGNLNYINKSILEIGVGASVQITDINMRTNDAFDCSGLIYKGYRGSPQVQGGHISWNGLHCVIDGLALQGLQMTATFQEHCTNFLNKLLSDAKGGLMNLLSKTIADERIKA
jgi:hypothetical protein